MSRIDRAYLRMQWRLLVNALDRNLGTRIIGALALVMTIFLLAVPWFVPSPSPDWMTAFRTHPESIRIAILLCWFMGFFIAGLSLFETRQVTHLRHHLSLPLSAADLFRLLILYLQLCLGSIIFLIVPLVGRSYYAASGSVTAALFGAAVFLAAIEVAFIGGVAAWSAIVTVLRRPVWLLAVISGIAAICTRPAVAWEFEPLHLASAALLDGDLWALARFLAEGTVITLLAREMYARGFIVHGLALADAVATRAPGTGSAHSRSLSPWRAAMRDEIRIHTRSIRLLLVVGIWLACGLIGPIIVAGINGELDATFFALLPPIGASVVLLTFSLLLGLAVATGGAEWKGDRRGALRSLPIRFGTILTGWATAGGFLMMLPYLGGAAILVILSRIRPEFAVEPWAAYALLFTPAVFMSGTSAVLCREAIPTGPISSFSLTGLSLFLGFTSTVSATVAIAAWLAVHGGLSGAADYALTVLAWILVLVLLGWIASLEKTEDDDSERPRGVTA